MRFTLRWLFDYLETDLGFEQLLETITMAGLEVEEAIDLGLGDGKIVFGEIVELGPHPDADKLSLCKVRSAPDTVLQIVCGADNIAVGQKVPLALVGANLPNGLKLKPTKIRGVASEGMMCATDELGVGDDHSGIWIQPDDSPVGEPFDAVLEIKVTPNRPDALSLVGVARDIAAKSGGKLVLPEVKFIEVQDKAETAARVSVEAKTDCPRYAARVIRNVRVQESPRWLKVRLEAAGLRPRNCVVDVTNYVMLELGHPLHAFDLDKLAGRAIVVRHPRPDEKLTLLDETEAQLDSDDLLICDAEKPVALAGIMGGENSEITEGTTNVLLEAAYFRPATIRRTAKRLGKSTDASYRFERGTDPRRLVNALHRAAQLIAELSGGEVLKGHLDATGRLPEREAIGLRFDRFNRISGLKLTGRQISDTLARLGFEVQRADEDRLVVAVPSHRPDIEGEADLIEEVCRIHGYDKIPVELPTLRNPAELPSSQQQLERLVTDALPGFGLSQAINFSFVGEEDNALVGFDGSDGLTVRVMNPLQRDQAVMRRSLVPSLLRSVQVNLNQNAESIRLFEIGKTYAWHESQPAEDEDPRTMDPPAEERPFLAVAIAGAIKADWRTPYRAYDFYDVKGVAAGLLEQLGISRLLIERVEDVPYLHPGRAAAFQKGNDRLCWFGELHPALSRELGFKKRVYLMEFPLDGPVLKLSEQRRYRELSRTPPIKRDIAVVVDADVPAMELERAIRSAGGELLTATRLFDYYAGERIEAGRKSLAFALTFRDPNPEKTLTDAQATEATEKILATLEKKHGAKLR